MTIVAEEYDHVMGADTRARTYTYAVVDTSTSACLATASFPTTAAAVEGTSSYGAGLTCALRTVSLWQR